MFLTMQALILKTHRNAAMNTSLREQVMSLPVDEKFDVMMALWGSLADDELPTLSSVEMAKLERLFEQYRDCPSPAVQYESVMERLRSHCQSHAG